MTYDVGDEVVSNECLPAIHLRELVEEIPHSKEAEVREEYAQPCTTNVRSRFTSKNERRLTLLLLPERRVGREVVRALGVPLGAELVNAIW